MNLISIGRSYEVYCLIKTLAIKTNKNGDPFLDLTISDSDGEMNAKLWNYSAYEHGSYSVGDVVKIRGQIVQFGSQDQMRIDKIRLCLDTDEFDASTVIPSAEYSGEDMMASIYSFCDKIEDNDLKRLVLALLADVKDKMLYWPAAFKLHHAMRGGLLYHTLSILRLAEGVCKIYPSIDTDLIYAGAILHDICKIDEFDANSLGLVKQYSTQGELLGHLVMGAMKVSEKAKELKIEGEKIMLLEHMIISHHGVPEYGAAVRPMTLEAIVLSELDNLDATIYEVENAVKGVGEGEFTERQWALDNRKLYNPGLKDMSTKADIL